MEYIRNLFSRYWATSSLLIIGIILIIYIALGFIYFQQGPKQQGVQEQIDQLTAVLSRPLPDIAELQAEYDKVTTLLIPKDPKDAIALLVGIAHKNGIDVSEEAGKFLIPSAGNPTSVTIGSNTYQVLSFDNILVQGEPDNVTSFITDLDTGDTLDIMVLTKVILAENLVVNYTGGEADRREEFRQVVEAVQEMIADNNITSIQNPINFTGGTAANIMGDDPDTPDVFEGFPDTITSTKGYSGNATPRDGYVLYQHDRITPENTVQFTTVDYYSSLITEYFYTSESDGTVRQWDGSDVLTANEFAESEGSRSEIKVIVSVNIYSRTRD